MTYLKTAHIKEGAHADDRLTERTSLRPSVLESLRKNIKNMDLPRGTHHTLLEDGSFAVLKDVGKRGRKKHVVATVMTPNMRRPGLNLTDTISRDGSKSVMSKRKKLYHGSPHRLDEIRPATATGKGDSAAREHAIYLANNPEEARLYALTRPRNNKRKGWAILDNKVHYVKGDPINKQGYVYEHEFDDYAAPPEEDPSLGYRVHGAYKPTKRKRVRLKGIEDQFVEHPDKDAYKTRVNEWLASREKTSSVRHTLITGHSGAGKSTLANSFGLPIHALDDDPDIHEQVERQKVYHRAHGGRLPTGPQYAKAMQHAERNALRRAFALKYPHVIEGSYLLNRDPEDLKEHDLHLVDTPEPTVLDRRVERQRIKDLARNRHWDDDRAAGVRLRGQQLIDEYAPGVKAWRSADHVKKAALKLEGGGEYRPRVEVHAFKKVKNVPHVLASYDGKTYNFPGGGTDGDSLSRAAMREFREEAGYDIHKPRLVGDPKRYTMTQKWQDASLGKRGTRYKGVNNHIIAAELGKRNTRILGKDDDAMGGLKLYPVSEVATNLKWHNRKLDLYEPDDWAQSRRETQLALEKHASLNQDVQLRPHQEDALSFLGEGGKAIYAHGTGTGKTLTSIAAFERLRERGHAKKALVIAPASLLTNFREHGVKKFTNSTVSAVGGGADYQLVSLEKFRRNPTEILDKAKADTIIVDEIHRSRNPRSSSFDALRTATRDPRIKNAIGLTGSLVSNHPRDIVPLADIIHGTHELGSSRKFTQKHVDTARISGGFLKPPSTKYNLTNVTKLRDKMKGMVHYVGHQDIQDMPALKIKDVNVEMSREQQKLYDFAMGKLNPVARARIRSGLPPSQTEAQHIFSVITKIRQASNSIGTHKKMGPAEAAEQTPKLKRALDDVQKHLSKTKDGQAVLYSNLVQGGARELYRGLEARGIPTGIYSGVNKELGVTKDSRDKAVSDFLKGKNKAIVLTGAGGEGISLNNATFFGAVDPHFNPEKNWQAIARARRFGGLSHRDKKDRVVDVRRYRSEPRQSWLGKKIFGREVGVDEWMQRVADEKDHLNEQIRDVSAKVGISKTAAAYSDMSKEVANELRERVKKKIEYQKQWPEPELPSRMYHSSSNKIDEFETRPHYLAEDEPVVFGTPSRAMAISHLARWRDSDFSQGTYNDDPTLHMEEQYPGALEKIYKGKRGYMYELDPKPFEWGPQYMRSEFVSKDVPKVINSEKLDAYKAMLAEEEAGRLKIHRYQQSKTAQKTRKSAVIIKGNPYYINKDSENNYENYYKQVAGILGDAGYKDVSYDPGEDYTTPKDADLWVGHSRGGGRLRLAPKHTKTLRLDDYEDGSEEYNKTINRAMRERGYKSIPEFPVAERPQPGKGHWTVTDRMRDALLKTANSSPIMSQEDIYERLKRKIPRGSHHVSGGLPDARGISDVDIYLPRKRFAGLGSRFPKGTSITESGDDYSIYTIPGYDREVNVYATNNPAKRESVDHRNTMMALAKKYPSLERKAFSIKQKGKGSEPAWAEVLELKGNPYDVMADTKHVLDHASKHHSTGISKTSSRLRNILMRKFVDPVLEDTDQTQVTKFGKEVRDLFDRKNTDALTRGIDENRPITRRAFLRNVIGAAVESKLPKHDTSYMENLSQISDPFSTKRSIGGQMREIVGTTIGGPLGAAITDTGALAAARAAFRPYDDIVKGTMKHIDDTELKSSVPLRTRIARTLDKVQSAADDFQDLHTAHAEKGRGGMVVEYGKQQVKKHFDEQARLYGSTPSQAIADTVIDTVLPIGGAMTAVNRAIRKRKTNVDRLATSRATLRKSALEEDKVINTAGRVRKKFNEWRLSRAMDKAILPQRELKKKPGIHFTKHAYRRYISDMYPSDLLGGLYQNNSDAIQDYGIQHYQQNRERKRPTLKLEEKYPMLSRKFTTRDSNPNPPTLNLASALRLGA